MPGLITNGDGYDDLTGAVQQVCKPSLDKSPSINSNAPHTQTQHVPKNADVEGGCRGEGEDTARGEL